MSTLYKSYFMYFFIPLIQDFIWVVLYDCIFKNKFQSFIQYCKPQQSKITQQLKLLFQL